MSPTNLSFEQTKFDCCGRIFVLVVGSMAISKDVLLSFEATRLKITYPSSRINLYTRLKIAMQCVVYCGESKNKTAGLRPAKVSNATCRPSAVKKLVICMQGCRARLPGKAVGQGHDYYSIWFNLSAAFFKSEKTTGVIKLKTHYFISNHFMKC
jgi:hypothetical protein